jgi:hypothetical protein
MSRKVRQSFRGLTTIDGYETTMLKALEQMDAHIPAGRLLVRLTAIRPGLN